MDYTPSFVIDDESAAAKKVVEELGGYWDMIHTAQYYPEPSLWEKLKALFKK